MKNYHILIWATIIAFALPFYFVFSEHYAAQYKVWLEGPDPTGIHENYKKCKAAKGTPEGCSKQFCNGLCVKEDQDNE